MTFIHKLGELRDRRGMNIILLAHPEVKTITNPQTQATYQRYELKLHKLSKAKVMEAVDAIFFAGYEMYTHKVGEEIKTIATKNRVLQGVPNQFDGYDAKNRYGLTEPLPLSMSWEDFIAHCDIKPVGSVPSLEEIRQETKGLLEKIADEDIKVKAKSALEKGWHDVALLSQVRDRMIALTVQ